MIEALRFTSGVSICSNDRVTFKKIHNARFTIALAPHSPHNASNLQSHALAHTCVVTASWTRDRVRFR
jgi:hypothetical protein